jgi:methyltransferase (TIGR00027 family)
MKPGQPSQTAVMVAAGRAIADGRTAVAVFSDPTAIHLLPPEAQARVERIRAGIPAINRRERFADAIAKRRAAMLVARTVAIDNAVRAAGAAGIRQLVILGAGLDGRAWRMAELRDWSVFEVDHPNTQRSKRERVAALTATAKDVRFVAVDFAIDDLDARLAAAGHDAAAPTLWIWEGVVMYLARSDVEKTLAIIARRSSSGSRLVVAYHAPARLMLAFVGWIVRRMGEPLRSHYTADQMRALLARHAFRVVADDDLPTLARRLTPEVAALARPMRHFRIAEAEKM